MALRRIKELLKDTVVYGLGTLTTKGLGFLLIPLYTRYLTPGDYGILALVNMWGAVIGVLIGLGQPRALFRFYFKESEREHGGEEVLSTFLYLMAAVGLACVCIVWFSRPLSAFLLGDAELAMLLVLVTAITYLEMIRKAPLVIIRVRRWTARYSMITVARALLTVSIIIYLVVGRGWGALGVLSGQATTAIVFTLLLSVLFLRHLRPIFSRRIASSLLRFGLPFVVGDLLLLVFRYANRYFLQKLASVDEVGQYALGNRFGEIILVLNTVIQTAWPVFLYGSEKDEGAPAAYARAMTYYIGIAGFVASAIVLFAPEIYAVMVHPNFHPSMQIIPVTVVTYVLMGVYVFGNVGINLKERTQYYMFVAAAAAATSVVLNLLLIPPMGMLGAALATLGAFAVQAALTLWVSLRLYPLRYEVLRIVMLAVTLSGAAAAGRLLLAQGTVATAAIKAGLLLVAVPAALFLLRFPTADERVQLTALARRLRRRP